MVAVLGSFIASDIHNIHFGVFTVQSINDYSGETPVFSQFTDSVSNITYALNNVSGNVSGFVTLDNGSTYKNNFIFMDILEAQDCDLHLGLFFVDLNSSGLSTLSNVGAGRSSDEILHDIPIAFYNSYNIDLTQILVNCDEFITTAEPSCHTMEEMQSDEFLQLLSTDFRIDENINNFYPYSNNVFQ